MNKLPKGLELEDCIKIKCLKKNNKIYDQLKLNIKLNKKYEDQFKNEPFNIIKLINKTEKYLKKTKSKIKALEKKYKKNKEYIKLNECMCTECKIASTNTLKLMTNNIYNFKKNN